jgi:hypothetical protein
VKDAAPVMEVLRGERDVEAIGVAEAGDVGGGGAVAQHLDDGVAGDEVDHQENNRDDNPEHGQGRHHPPKDGTRGVEAGVWRCGHMDILAAGLR